MPARPLTVLIAPDSFKGSLTSVEVARALADGWARARPDDTVLLCPLADGGEGTLEAVAAAGGWVWQESTVTDPLGRPIRARWLRDPDGVARVRRDGRGVRPVAGRRGRARCDRGDIGRDRGPDPGRDRRGRDDRSCWGSAAAPRPMAAPGCCARSAPRPTVTGPSADLAGLDPRLALVDLAVACDVSNPLLGPSGAAAVYGPQKGASPADVVELDRRLARFADALEAAAGTRVRDVPGPARPAASASGCWPWQDRFRSFALRPGIDLVMDATDFPARLAGADLVITGEGRIDAQTAFGKTALGVAQRAAGGGRPVHRGRWRSRARGDRGPRARSAPWPSRSSSDRRPSRRRWPPAPRRSSAAASGWRGSSRSSHGQVDSASDDRNDGRVSSTPPVETAEASATASAAASKPQRARPRPRKRKFSDPGRTWAKRLERYRPGLVPFVLDGLGRAVRAPDVGAPARPDQRADPHDPDPEQRRHRCRGGVRGASLALPGHGRGRGAQPGRRLGRRSGCPTGSSPTGPPSSSRHSPSWSRRSGRAASATRRRHGSRRPCGISARNAATTPSSSWATCRPSRRATG